MQYEIERKFLVRDTKIIDKLEGKFYKQAYIETADKTGITPDNAYLTIKGPNNRIKRLEYEYIIPKKDANEIIDNLCQKSVIEKNRYVIYHDNRKWEIDQFLGQNKGLVIAEIELEKEDTKFTKPEWLGEEVTNDTKYLNCNLTKNPFINWNN